ncbi:hypothetical protein S7S_15840 [Isoalcanivorax pacificus W11-5]|uniref:Guanylate cyclase domain-containing protein n=1 Tax=Isoalcanivorax pacificus W11-5 TaxID=391936 RepID=A0A0B4XS34_9GAMM|nr:hypothetical protein [Isoalcanivorax pacificus]AJD49580.1 hypothetical protein S7S_15840 [Isoalcanivorax pacificus W11-5]
MPQADMARWRQWIIGERPLLRELAVLLLASLLIGLYFLEHLDSRLAEARRDYLGALAIQVAENAVEYTATNNLVSLNVIARRTGELGPVARVTLEDAGGRVLASSGTPVEAAPVQQPMRLADGGIVGVVKLWPAAETATRKKVEAGFVLLVLCLLGLRVLVLMLERRLRGEPLWHLPPAAPAPVEEQAPEAAAPVPVTAVLRLALVNEAHLRGRYTDSLFASLLAPYEQALAEVTLLYGGALQTRLDEGALIGFQGEPADAAFNAVCAGMLFLKVSRQLAEQRKQAGQMALEFKLLVTGDRDPVRSLACCEAGVPGRLHVPENELLALSLDTRSLYRPEQALTVHCADGDDLRLQPLEQLAQRYQAQINDQAVRLAVGAPESGVGSPQR